MMGLISKINEARHIKLRQTGQFPDNVMIHPNKKSELTREINKFIRDGINLENARVFGMKIIWTESIGREEVICTFN